MLWNLARTSDSSHKAGIGAAPGCSSSSVRLHHVGFADEGIGWKSKSPNGGAGHDSNQGDELKDTEGRGEPPGAVTRNAEATPVAFPPPALWRRAQRQARAEPPDTLTSFFVLSSWKKLALILPADLQQMAPLAHRSSAPLGPRTETAIRYLPGRDGQRSAGQRAGCALCTLYTRWIRAAPPTRTAPRSPLPAPPAARAPPGGRRGRGTAGRGCDTALLLRPGTTSTGPRAQSADPLPQVQRQKLNPHPNHCPGAELCNVLSRKPACKHSHLKQLAFCTAWEPSPTSQGNVLPSF